MVTYVEALCRELVARCKDEPLKTIYFGGGTPSLLSSAQLQKIVDTIRNNYDLSKLEEVTIETNPEDLTTAYLEGLVRLGLFNRISIGIQSFSDRELHMLNRVHDGRQAVQAIDNAVLAGFRNISVDLIMALPGQSVDDWKKNLDILSSLDCFDAVKHLSCYELTVEHGTMLERQIVMGRLQIADDDMATAQYQVLQEWCATQGFVQYEVSNYCRSGFHSRHNSRYWDRTPYIGVGASAHSFDGHSRRWNVDDVNSYVESSLQGDVVHEEEILSAADAYNEYVMTALRTCNGLLKSYVSEEYRPFLKERMARFIASGLIVETPESYVPTQQGLLHADGIAAELFV